MVAAIVVAATVGGSYSGIRVTIVNYCFKIKRTILNVYYHISIIISYHDTITLTLSNSFY